MRSIESKPSVKQTFVSEKDFPRKYNTKSRFNGDCLAKVPVALTWKAEYMRGKAG